MIAPPFALFPWIAKSRQRSIADEDYSPAPPQEIHCPEGKNVPCREGGGCLRNAKRVELSAEELRRRQVRRQLLLELERERAKARQRAARQRKELELAPAVDP